MRQPFPIFCRRSPFLLIIFSLFFHAAEGLATNDFGGSPKKSVFFIGTGGTIAGTAAKPGDPNYDPGTVTIDAILKSVPDIQKIANISGEQLLDTIKMKKLIAEGLSAEEARKQSYVNICSCDVAEHHWQLLAQRINTALNEEDQDAVIVTHGTDTIEETAFALQFLVHSQKPVILIGAARPSNHADPDGPTNIRHAVRTAINDKASSKGVMVVMGGRIYPAFDVTEIRAALATQALQHRFTAPHFGLLGKVSQSGRINWNKKNKLLGAKILNVKFNSDVGIPLPQVPILLQYAGTDSADLVPMYEAAGKKAFVYAGFGVGSTPKSLRDLIKGKFEKNEDIVFVNASRTKESLANIEMDFMKGAVYSGTLSPFHAKIFLQLTLQGLDQRDPHLMEIIKGLAPNATLREKVKAIWSEYLYLGVGISPTAN